VGWLGPCRLKREVLDLGGRNAERPQLCRRKSQQLPNSCLVAVSLHPTADCGGHRCSPSAAFGVLRCRQHCAQGFRPDVRSKGKWFLPP
jgi:hypothetical protein